MQVALSPSVASFFHEAIDEAMKDRQVRASEAATGYLVEILVAFAHPDPRIEETLARPLAFVLDDALQATGAERFERLRALGDGVLYLAGFFSDHVETRGVDSSYLESIGTTAYGGVAAMVERRAAREAAERSCGRKVEDTNVFGELAGQFQRFVEVLGQVADRSLARQARGERGLLRVYERWLRTGSSALAAELGARGLVPVRGRTGVH